MRNQIKGKNKNFVEEIEIPENIEVEIKNGKIVVKKDEKEITRKLNRITDVKVENRKIVMSLKKDNKKGRKILYSLMAHIKNAFEGLINGFKYKLKIVFVHFPITVEIDKKNEQILIKNFLGEKKPRIVKMVPGVEVRLNKDEIEIESADIEKAGQFAADIEKKTRIRFRDRRVFQDGIFITEKPGVNYLE